MDGRAALPAIGKLLALPDVAPLTAEFGKGAVTEALREVVARARAGEIGAEPAAVVAAAGVVLRASARGTLVSVINATGVVLHTNLGRAALGAEARVAVERAGSGYSSL